MRGGCVGFLALVLAACASSVAVDGGAADSGPVDSGADAGPAALQCGDTVSTFCVDATCVGTWAEVEALPCPPVGGTDRYSAGTCAGYDVAWHLGADRSEAGFFDADSGALVAVL